MGSKQKEYAEIEKSNFSTEDFRRPAYAIKRLIRDQSKQIKIQSSIKADNDV